MSDRLSTDLPPAPAREALLADLNPAQREAVTHPGGPLLIVAGAGSGKTRVLTRRAGWLVAGGLPGPSLLCITFTNKAATVLRERLAGMPGGGGIWAGTFHGFCAWLLRRHGARIGLDERFTIADRDDQLRLLKGLLEEQGGAVGRLRPAEVLALISRRKNGDPGPPGALGPADAERLSGLASAYAARLRAASLLDFDDLLLEARRLLVEAPDARAAVERRFAHVLVDEYQDTNRVQRDLLLHLLGPARNLTVVGDPDQSIYRWRGATVSNILRFADDLPGAKVVVLERNYRTTARLLAAAEGVIGRNRERYDKRLVADRPPGERVQVIRCADAADEAGVVAEAVDRWRAAGGALGGVAVIYRVNALSRAVELALGARRLPYRVVAGVEFFQRQEVKDVLAYARLLENPRDLAAFQRIANVPRRGVGETSLSRLLPRLAEAGQPFEQLLATELPGVPRKAQAALRGLGQTLARLRALPRAPVAPLLEELLQATGYRAWLEEAGGDPDGARRENVAELLGAAHEHDRARRGEGLGAFLEQAGLVSDQDGLVPGEERVHLLSAHAAKGLEFPCVIVVGAEQGYFPHARSVVEDGGLEEERRLFYVALTRAQDRLLVTHAAWRFVAAGLEPRAPSPFLRDMPAASVEGRDRAAGLGPRGGRPGGGPEVEEGLPGLEPVPFDPGERAGAAREEPAFRRGGDLEPGDRVRHPYFGEGRLVGCRGSGEERLFTVDFDGCGTKTIAQRYARLERLP